MTKGIRVTQPRGGTNFRVKEEFAAKGNAIFFGNLPSGRGQGSRKKVYLGESTTSESQNYDENERRETNQILIRGK